MNITRNVIIRLFDHFITKCIFNEYSNLHYLHLMINDVIKMKPKVWFGVEIQIWDINSTILSINIYF